MRSHKIIECLFYLLQTPVWLTAIVRLLRQASRSSEHTLSYVRPSVPQTGLITAGHGWMQTHLAAPSRSTEHCCPTPGHTAGRLHGLRPATEFRINSDWESSNTADSDNIEQGSEYHINGLLHGYLHAE